MSNVIYLSNVRLSFPHLIEPQKRVDATTGKERVSYNCEFIMPASHPGYQQFMKEYGAMALEKWKEHANTVMQLIHADRKSRCYGVGEEKVNKKTFQPYDGYAGGVYITAGKESPPQIIQSDGTPIDPANSMAYQQLTRRMYGGCRVNAAVKPWVQDNKHGRGIRCDLIAVQFAGDDKPFGEGAADVTGIFGAVQTAPASVASVAPVMPGAPFPGAPGASGLPSFLGGN